MPRPNFLGWHMASTAAIARKPDALLVAFAIYCGLKEVPEQNVWISLSMSACCLPGIDIPVCPYEEIYTGMIRKILGIALEEKLAASDKAGISLIHKLQEKFGELFSARASGPESRKRKHST